MRVLQSEHSSTQSGRGESQAGQWGGMGLGLSLAEWLGWGSGGVCGGCVGLSDARCLSGLPHSDPVGRVGEWMGLRIRYSGWCTQEGLGAGGMGNRRSETYCQEPSSSHSERVGMGMEGRMQRRRRRKIDGMLLLEDDGWGGNGGSDDNASGLWTEQYWSSSTVEHGWWNTHCE